MDCSQLLNDPIIAHFFQSIQKQDTKSTLKQLVILGIHAVSSRIHQQTACCCCKGSSASGVTRSGYQGGGGLTYVPYQMGNEGEGSALAQEIQRIKTRVDQIAAHSNLNGQFNNSHSNNKNHGRAPLAQKNQSSYVNTQQNACHTLPNISQQQANRRIKFRHHLDDSEVRQALVNPYAKNSPIKKREKQRQEQAEKRRSLQKMHEFQKQKDNAEIKNKNLKQTEQHYSNKKQHQQMNTASKNKQTLQQSQSQSKSNSKSNQDQNLKFKKIKQSQRPSSKSFNQNTKYNYNDAYQTKSINTMTNNNNKYSSQQSKIKSLISKDKQRSKRRAQQKRIQDNRAKYCQFQYSDEQLQEQQQEQEQSSQQHQSEQNDGVECPVHPEASTAKKGSNIQSSYKKSQKSKMKDEEVFGQIYKSNRKKIKESIKDQQYSHERDQEASLAQQNQVLQQNEQEEDDDENVEWDQNQQGSDEVSENSSFSKFSMNSNSKRESGKISGLKGRK